MFSNRSIEILLFSSLITANVYILFNAYSAKYTRLSILTILGLGFRLSQVSNLSELLGFSQMYLNSSSRTRGSRPEKDYQILVVFLIFIAYVIKHFL
jgi:hypothetical protein